jgi:rhodanese-related sulfurtransferase
MKIFLPIFLALSLLVPSLGMAAEKFKLLNVAEVLSLREQRKDKLMIFDANGSSTRSSKGIVPGAHLLSSVSDYDVAKTLPTDKSTALVFYCANERCTASHDAAERAAEAGYPEVYVMSPGIKGWIDAGQKVAAVK